MTGSTRAVSDHPGRCLWQDELERLLQELSHINLTEDIYEETPHLQAHGGFCDVFRAKSRRHEGVSIAVKRIRIHISQNRNIVKMICRELKIWSSLNHPNVLSLLGFVMNDKYPALVSHWMINGTMRQYMETNPEIKILAMAEGIAKGLKYLHEKDVIHSDLKPDNVLVSNFGEPLLADFGISRIMTTVTTTTSTKFVDGSARYMAVELLRTNNGEDANSGLHTKASDVWAYGMVVYELLTRSVPFTSQRNDYQVAMAIVNGQMPTVPSLFARANTDSNLLWDVCQECWKESPADRPSMELVLNSFTTVTLATDSGPPIFHQVHDQHSDNSTLSTRPSPFIMAGTPNASRIKAIIDDAETSNVNRPDTQSDLEREIELHEEALASCPPGHIDRRTYLSNLADTLIDRYNRVGTRNDLERAIALHSQASVLCPPGHWHALT